MEQRRHLLVFSQQREKKQTLYATHIMLFHIKSFSCVIAFCNSCLSYLGGPRMAYHLGVSNQMQVGVLAVTI